MITKENQVYVTRQPSHIASSIVVLTQEFPLIFSLHDKLDQLHKMSDVMFVFCPDIYDAQKSISLNKFASLYESCAYIKSGSVNQAILKLMEYDKEIFNKHLSTLIFMDTDLIDADLDVINKMIMGTTTKPILSIKRLLSGELFEFYRTNRPKINSWLDFPKIVAWNIVNGNSENTEMMFSSYCSSSKFILLRGATSNIILNFSESEEGKQFISSFTSPDFKYLFGSVIKYLAIDYLDASDYENALK